MVTDVTIQYKTEIKSINPTSFEYDYCNHESSSPSTKPSTYEYDHNIIKTAATLLSQGEIIGFPTETVYGLAANALNPCAISKIFLAKGRPSDNPLIVHISSLSMLYTHILPHNTKIPEIYEKVIQQYWPGPLTILLPYNNKNIPSQVVSGQSKIGVRFPSHPIARALIDACGFPLAAPSANTSGRPSPTLAIHVLNDLNHKIPLIIDGGPCLSGIESTVLDGLSNPPAILRPGGVTFERLKGLKDLHTLTVFGRDFRDEKLENSPTTPGMKYTHYKPDAQVILIEHCDNMEEKIRNLLINSKGTNDRIGLLRTRNYNFTKREIEIEDLYLGSKPDQIAHELFRGLRELESRGVSVILIEGISDQDEGLAVMNRVKKAASRIISSS